MFKWVCLVFRGPLQPNELLHMSHGQNTRRPLYQGGERFCITHAKTMENDKVSPKNDNP